MDALRRPDWRRLFDGATSGSPTLGARVEGVVLSEGAPFAVFDKFTGERLATVHEATPAIVRHAVGVAQSAAQASIPRPTDRHEILKAAADLLGRRKADLVDLVVAETGFALADAGAEVQRAMLTLSLCADEARRLEGEAVSFAATAGQESRLGFTLRVPVGVVCAITPFNSPLNTVAHKIGPAIAAGNAVVLKPSGLTPLCADVLVRILIEAGLPPGVISVVHGDGAAVGRLLLSDPRIGFYTFTGSTRVGKEIAREAGLRRTQLELGSIASAIVCRDADLAVAAPKIASSAFRKSGQVCTSLQRVYVEASRADELARRLLDESGKWIVGDPRLPATRMGPLISADAAQRARTWLDEAQAGQARILTGGERTGAAVAPTIVANVSDEMKIVAEEVFAPIVSIVPFERLDDAVRGANATPYGLAVGLFSNNLAETIGLVRQLRFGAVHINETSSARADGMPFGGVKDSGHGREGPRYAAREMSEEVLVTFNP